MPESRLEELASRLEHAAAELRGGELPADRAASLVDECARLASEASADLDRLVRADGADVVPGQLALGS